MGSSRRTFLKGIAGMGAVGSLGGLSALLPMSPASAADATVTHNGVRFDMPKIRGRSLVHGLTPPSPVKEIDTYLICRKELGFDGNSLEYVAKVLGLIS